MDRQTI